MKGSRQRLLMAVALVGLAVLLSGRLAAIGYGQHPSSVPLGSGLGHPVPKEALQDSLYKITRNMFIENLDTSFSFSRPSGHVADLVLIEVNNLNPPFVKGTGNTSRECFSLIFRGSAEPALKQDTYLVRHKKLGEFRLFIVPGDSRSKLGPHYEALINRVYP